MSPSIVKKFWKIILDKSFLLFVLVCMITLIYKFSQIKFYYSATNHEPSTVTLLQQIEKQLLDNQTLIITKEIESQNLTELRNLDELVMEKGGQPIRNIIFTTWRSGSTFLGQLVNSHPGSFYYFEPFMQLGENRINDSFSMEAVQQIQNLFNCHFNASNEYIKYTQSNITQDLVPDNARIWNICNDSHKFCLDPNFLGKLCQKFPFLLIKTVRMKLSLARPLLENRRLNLRVLYLVRDPRGVMWSRFEQEWCLQYRDCRDPQVLCPDDVDDFFEAEKLSKAFPETFRVVRYEDLCANVHLAATEIFKFFRLSLKPLEDPEGSVREFIKNHTESFGQDVDGTLHDTKQIPFKWIEKAKTNFSVLAQIEQVCERALEVWGYNSVHSLEQISDPNFNPVKDLDSFKSDHHRMQS